MRKMDACSYPIAISFYGQGCVVYGSLDSIGFIGSALGPADSAADGSQHDVNEDRYEHPRADQC